MIDRFDKKKRSQIMSTVKNKNTAPEKNIRKALYSKGLRYKLQNKNLPGNPDLVFVKYNAVIFVNGCFWHKHDCRLASIPQTNGDFWLTKLSANVARDKKNIKKLKSMGWRIKVIWTCSLKNKMFISDSQLNEIVKWIKDR